MILRVSRSKGFARDGKAKKVKTTHVKRRSSIAFERSYDLSRSFGLLRREAVSTRYDSEKKHYLTFHVVALSLEVPQHLQCVASASTVSSPRTDPTLRRILLLATFAYLGRKHKCKIQVSRENDPRNASVFHISASTMIDADCRVLPHATISVPPSETIRTALQPSSTRNIGHGCL